VFDKPTKPAAISVVIAVDIMINLDYNSKAKY